MHFLYISMFRAVFVLIEYQVMIPSFKATFNSRYHDYSALSGTMKSRIELPFLAVIPCAL